MARKTVKEVDARVDELTKVVAAAVRNGNDMRTKFEKRIRAQEQAKPWHYPLDAVERRVKKIEDRLKLPAYAQKKAMEDVASQFMRRQEKIVAETVFGYDPYTRAKPNYAVTNYATMKDVMGLKAKIEEAKTSATHANERVRKLETTQRPCSAREKADRAMRKAVALEADLANEFAKVAKIVNEHAANGEELENGIRDLAYRLVRLEEKGGADVPDEVAKLQKTVEAYCEVVQAFEARQHPMPLLLAVAILSSFMGAICAWAILVNA